MKKQNKNKAKYFVVFIIAFVAIIFLSGMTLAEDRPAIKKAEILDNTKTGEYLSPVYNTDFKFNIFGFQLSNETDYLQVRYYDKNGWSGWINPEVLKSKDGQNITEPILTDEGGGIQYKMNSGNVSKVKIIYLASDTQKVNGIFNIFNWLFSKAGAESTLNIISRASWQADETWRLNSSGAEIWPVEYEQPQKFVIHHTAGSDGGTDPAATVRGVYYWHAIVMGWGDIGYNYLIDQQGNIYEGRYGGDGVIGANVYRDKTCAKLRFGDEKLEASFNPGSIGIAVLGDYNNLTLSDTVRNSLTDLIAQKAKDFEIIPDGQGYFIDNTYPNIVGHLDLDCTECPGTNLYSQLSIVRQEAQTKYLQLGGVAEPIIKATYIGQSEQPVVINAGSTKEVWVDFKNDGNVTWRNYNDETLKVVALASPSDFYVAGWASTSEVAKLTTANVAPGEVGRFVFNVKAPNDKLDLEESFQLNFNNNVLEGTNFTVKASIIGLPYAASLDSQNVQPASFINARQNITIKFKNRGTQTWQKGKVKLYIYDLGDNVSRYFDASWPGKYGQINFQENEVKQDEIATFIFKLKSPSNPGKFINTYRLIDEQKIVNNEISTITRVDSIYQAKLINQNIPPAVLNVWRLSAMVKFKNVGLSTWNSSTVLKVYDFGDRVSRFKDKSWLDNYTVARLKEKSVKRGEVGTFTFYFKAPSQPGLYLNRFQLFTNNQAVNGGSFIPITRVDKYKI